MNVKLHTPKSLQSGSGMSSLKQLLLSLIATTISIVLTFGTAAFLDRNKKAQEKREMVMMILNDMSNSIDHMEDIDSAALQAFEAQLSILQHPETFETKKYDFVLLQVAYLNPTSSTVENIFSSNIETINTLGNITFTEMVSEFYFLRRQYSDVIAKDYTRMFDGETNFFSSIDSLRNYDLSDFLAVCESYLLQQKEILRLCQKMMDVSDEDLASFVRAREELQKRFDSGHAEKSIRMLQERKERFRQAVEAGSQSHR